MLNNQEQQALEYIQINHKNKIEELSAKSHITETMNLLNSLTLAEENVGGEINKFFLNVLPENKEGETLKVLMAISNKTKTDKELLENNLSEIMNRPETDTVTLTKELSEQLSIILKEIFKKIKKKSKIKNFSELKQKTQNYLPNFNQDDILKKYKIKNSTKNFIDNEVSGIKKVFSMKNSNVNLSPNFLKLKPQCSHEDCEILYRYKEFKKDKNSILPEEMLILMRKFSMVKKLKLTINKDYISNSISEEGLDNISYANNIDINIEQSDIQNNILILLNLDWLFQSLVDLEVDLSNDYIIESQINLYRNILERFAKYIHKDIKITTYKNNALNKRNYDISQKSIFSQLYHLEDDDMTNDKFSKSMMTSSSNLNYSIYSNTNNNINNNININDDNIKTGLSEFIKKNLCLLEMIIIYGYFIRRFEKIINIKFIFPLNLGEEISEMSKKQNILMSNFHFLSFIQKSDLLRTTIDFNSLDNQTFEKLLNFLNQNQNISVCNLSFFPDEEYFRTELLFKILQNCDENFKLKKNKRKKLTFNPNAALDLKGNEDLDNFILRKLSEYFEKNLKKFFYFLTIKTCITELSLIFDIPTILTKNGYYNNILMKFFLDLFIFIDSSKNNIKTLTLSSDNFVFDSRKYPILNDFCDKLYFYLKKDHKLTSLTFQIKFYNIRKIYRFIPYNLTYLSIGSFDSETFNCLVDYLTSSDYSLRAKLAKLKISLNNSVIDINRNKIYENIVRLFAEYPKGLTEISLYSFLIISYDQLYNLLMKTNYNTLPHIFMQFSIKSFLKDKDFENKFEFDLNTIDKNICIKADTFINLYCIHRQKSITSLLINLMMHLGEKNKDIMQYSIYSNIEKFLCNKEKKKVLIHFK